MSQHAVTAIDAGAGPELAALAAAALEFDADEAAPVLRRLAAPPAGRRAVWLRAGDAAGPTGLVAASVAADPTVGHLDLIAVRPEHRRRGVGRALVRAAERELAVLGVTEVRWAGNAPCYAWPGIDVRYTAAVCCAESLGYLRHGEAHNMLVGLADLAAHPETEAAGPDGDITVRRATPADLPALTGWAGGIWGDAWAWEIEQSVLGGPDGPTRNPDAPPVAACHLAERAGDMLAFAGFGANRPSWFGPMGTDPAARGLGLGAVLLRRCLADQRAAGLSSAQIAWAGPVAFYARTVGARLDRVFWSYRRTL